MKVKTYFPLDTDCELEVKNIIGRFNTFQYMKVVGCTTNIKDLRDGDLSKFFTFKFPQDHEEFKNQKEWTIHLADKQPYRYSKIEELDGENPAYTYILKHGQEYEVHITHWKPGDFRVYILAKNLGVVNAVMYLKTKKPAKK